MRTSLATWARKLKRFVTNTEDVIFHENKYIIIIFNWFFFKLWLKFGATRQDLDIWTENLRKVSNRVKKYSYSQKLGQSLFIEMFWVTTDYLWLQGQGCTELCQKSKLDLSVNSLEIIGKFIHRINVVSKLKSVEESPQQNSFGTLPLDFHAG